jgi:hypothetical protein
MEKQTIPLTAATHNELFLGHVGFATRKRKWLTGSDFVAS